MDFSDPVNFDVVRGIRTHQLSAFLVALTAMQHGLDVVFYRTQAEAGTRIVLFPDDFDMPAFYSVGDARRRIFMHGTQSERSSASTANITRDKVATKALLHRKNIDTAIGGPVSAKHPRLLYALAKAGVTRFVLKPIAGSMGEGTFLNQTPQQAEQILRMNPTVDYVIEQHVPGVEHRVYVVDNRIVAAYSYERPHVVGDGVMTLRQLYAQHQAIRATNPFVVDRTLEPAEIELALLMQRIGWNDVPEAGRSVMLSTSPIPDAQGNFTGCADTLPVRMRQTALAAARAVAAKNCAIDMILDRSGTAFVLEVNIRAMIGPHSFLPPSGAWNLDVPFAILASHFPIPPAPVREVTRFDFPALRAEIFREGRSGRGVAALDFARFDPASGA